MAMLGLYICGIESKSFVKCLRFTLKCQTTTHFAFSFTKFDIFDIGGTDILLDIHMMNLNGLSYIIAFDNYFKMILFEYLSGLSNYTIQKYNNIL